MQPDPEIVFVLDSGSDGGAGGGWTTDPPTSDSESAGDASGADTSSGDDSDDGFAAGNNGVDITGSPGHVAMKALHFSLVVILGALACIMLFFVFHRDRIAGHGYVTLVTPGCVNFGNGTLIVVPLTRDGGGAPPGAAATTTTTCSVWSFDVLSTLMGTVVVSVLFHATVVAMPSFRKSVRRRFLWQRGQIQTILVLPPLCAVAATWSGSATVSHVLGVSMSGAVLSAVAALVERQKSTLYRRGARRAFHVQRPMSGLFDAKYPLVIVLWLLQCAIIVTTVVREVTDSRDTGYRTSRAFVIAATVLVVVLGVVVLQSLTGKMTSDDYEMAWTLLMFASVGMPAFAVLVIDGGG